MDRCRVDGWIDGWMDKWKGARVHGYFMSGCMDVCMGWMHQCIDAWT